MGQRLAGVLDIGSDIAGFSPIMYMPWISSRCIASMISTTVSPALSSSGVSHSASNLARTCGFRPTGSRDRPSG